MHSEFDTQTFHIKKIHSKSCASLYNSLIDTISKHIIHFVSELFGNQHPTLEEKAFEKKEKRIYKLLDILMHLMIPGHP
jgi:hypothetical protein